MVITFFKTLRITLIFNYEGKSNVNRAFFNAPLVKWITWRLDTCWWGCEVEGSKTVLLARENRLLTVSCLSKRSTRVIIKFLWWEDVKPGEIWRRLTDSSFKKRFQGSKSTTSEKFPMAESSCKMRPVHDDGEQAPERRRFLQSVRWLKETTALPYGKLLHASEYRMGVLKGYRKVLARWVPRLFMEDQKANRLAVCERLGTI